MKTRFTTARSITTLTKQCRQFIAKKALTSIVRRASGTVRTLTRQAVVAVRHLLMQLLHLQHQGQDSRCRKLV